MDVESWLAARAGIAHRDEVGRAGFTAGAVAAAVRAGRVRRVRRVWVALPRGDGELIRAAELGGRVACLSVARRRGWWIPEQVDVQPHLHFRPNGRAVPFDGVSHWTKPLSPVSPSSLLESVEDALAHIASCLDREAALVVWESAIRSENLSTDALRSVRWRSRASAECAAEVNGLSDSGLETIAIVRLSRWGVPIRQQLYLAGHPVDLLIGDRLVVQLDGFAHHSTSKDRTRDLRHDAELRLRGYTVLRFSYAQVIHDWPAVERTIGRAIAAGAHLA